MLQGVKKSCVFPIYYTSFQQNENNEQSFAIDFPDCLNSWGNVLSILKSYNGIIFLNSDRK